MNAYYYFPFVISTSLKKRSIVFIAMNISNYRVVFFFLVVRYKYAKKQTISCNLKIITKKDSNFYPCVFYGILIPKAVKIF